MFDLLHHFLLQLLLMILINSRMLFILHMGERYLEEIQQGLLM